MTPHRSHLARLFVFACATLLLAGSASAARLSEEIEKTYRLQDGGEVILQNVNGSITVETWDQDRAELRVVKKVKAPTSEGAQEALEAFQIVIDSTPDRLRVEARKPRDEDSGFFGWMRSNRVEYSASFHLRIPRRADLEADSVNGSVTVQGLEGRLDVGTVNGQVTLTEIAGHADVATTNGRVQVLGARGVVSAATTNGGIEVELTEVASDADLRFTTTNGGVELRLPGDLRTRLDARTTNGGITCDLPMEVEGPQRKKRLRADLNGGGPGSLEVRTTNGGIRIREI